MHDEKKMGLLVFQASAKREGAALFQFERNKPYYIIVIIVVFVIIHTLLNIIYIN